MNERLLDLSKLAGWRNLFFIIVNATYTVTQADLDFLRPIYWLALVLFLASAFLEWIYSLKKTQRQFSLMPYSIWIIAIVGLCAASQAWAYSPESVTNSQYIANLAYVTITLTGLFLCTKNQVDVYRSMKLYVLAAVIMSVFLMITQALSGNISRIGTAFGIVPNGPAMQMGFAFMFCLLLLGKGECSKQACLGFSAILIIAIVLTDSRKIMLAAALAALVFYSYSKRGFLDMRKLMLAVLLAGIVVAAVVFVPFLNETIGYRLVGVFTGTFSDGTVDASSLEREFYRKTALTLFAQQPIFGIGFEGFSAYLTAIGYWHVAYSHCNYTELLCNLGIVGLCVYYSFYLGVIVLCFRNKRVSPFVCAAVALIILVRLLVEYGQVVYIDVDNYVVLFLLYATAMTARHSDADTGALGQTGHSCVSYSGGRTHE